MFVSLTLGAPNGSWRNLGSCRTSVWKWNEALTWLPWGLPFVLPLPARRASVVLTPVGLGPLPEPRGPGEIPWLRRLHRFQRPLEVTAESEPAQAGLRFAVTARPTLSREGGAGRHPPGHHAGRPREPGWKGTL